MKVYVSADLEGVAGIVDWDQVRPGGSRYDEGCALLLGEVNAVLEGAADAGATELLVNDAHGRMVNLAPQGLARRARSCTGRVKPDYMMEGLDSGFDAVCYVGYHGSMGTSSTLSHTYYPAAFAEVALNGVVVGESGINALCALGHGVPVVLVTGDDVTADEARRHCPAIVTAVVKRSVSRFAADSLHPEAARELVYERAREAVATLGAATLPAITLPATLSCALATTDYADLAARVAGVERTAAREVRLTGDDPLELYRRFVTVVLLCRGLVE